MSNVSLPSSVYDILKWISVVCIPALITFLGVVLPAAGVDPATTQMVLTIIGAVGTFIGALIGVSCYNYNKELNDVED